MSHEVQTLSWSEYVYLQDLHCLLLAPESPRERSRSIETREIVAPGGKGLDDGVILCAYRTPRRSHCTWVP